MNDFLLGALVSVASLQTLFLLVFSIIGLWVWKRYELIKLKRDPADGRVRLYFMSKGAPLFTPIEIGQRSSELTDE